jgi:hypothetical protein
MNKKYKLPLVLFLISMVLNIVGALFKIQHWPGASFMLVIGILSQALAIVLLILALLKNTK